MILIIMMGLLLLAVFVPAFFIWLVLMQPTRNQKKRGFEVKLTPGKTAGLIEKKEE